MAHVLSWPKRRALTTEDGVTLLSVLSPGRLELRHPDGRVLTFTDPAELRAFAMQAHAAAVEYDQERQHAAAKASADRRQRRALAGQPTGLRHHPFTDPPEPPLHADLESA